jgi:pimeloyl-ACP methyl ester carboxylesterase
MKCELENISVNYEVIGEGRPIVMLHGWPLDHRQMKFDMEPLFVHRDGWKRFYLDLPGMGQTPGMDWITNQDQMLEVVLAFIDKVIPGQHLVVAGASYGGLLARGVLHQRLALVDGLLLIVPSIKTESTKRTLPPKVTLVEDWALVSELDSTEVQGFIDVAVVQSRKLVEAMRAVIIPAVQIADYPFLSRIDANANFSFDVDQLPEAFLGPTLILTGRQDHVCGYRDTWNILENFPRATFAVVDCAGHALTVEREGIAHALMTDWLSRLEITVKS